MSRRAGRRMEPGEIDGIGVLDQILVEELTLRENRSLTVDVWV